MDEHSSANRIQQFYGYAVCLISVVTFLFSTGTFINAAFDRMRPAAVADTFYGPMTEAESFESYKAERRATLRGKGDTTAQLPADSILRQDFSTMRANRRASFDWQATKSMATSVLMMLITAILFATHWRWVRRITNS